MPTPLERRIEVPGARVARWVTGFGDRHDGARLARAGSVAAPGAAEGVDGAAPVLLVGGDGATATLTAWPGEPPGPRADAGDPAAVAELTAWAHGPTDLVLILIRRGGYAVGLAQGADLTAHKSGTRYVQSRTAAGGWSQQRFARRRGNQSDELVAAVVAHVERLVGAQLPRAAGLVLGGDRALAAQVLAQARPRGLEDLPRRSFHDIGDPRLGVLTDVLDRARGLQIVLREPGAG